MGAYYTNMVGVGVTNLLTTFTHSLSITPSLLAVRVIGHQVPVTATAPLLYGTVGTNIVTVASGVGTLQTCDIEVQQIFSMNQ